MSDDEGRRATITALAATATALAGLINYFSKLALCLPGKCAMLGNHGFSPTSRNADFLRRSVKPVHTTRWACTAAVPAVVAPTILRTAIVILPKQKTKECECKIDAMRDRAKIDRDRRFTPPIAYLRKPAHCGPAARVAPPSLRFTLCTGLCDRANFWVKQLS